MRLIKPLLIVSFLLALVPAVWVAFNFHEDIPLEEMKAKYCDSESRFMQLDGMEVHYKVEGSGFPLVLLHGTSSSLHTWDAWTPLLKDSFTIVRMDLPAFGITGPRPDSDYGMDMYVRFVDSVVTRLGYDRFHIAGNSFGGHLAWEYTLSHPDKVSAQVLIDAAGYPRHVPPPLAFRIAAMPLINQLFTQITPYSIVEKSCNEVYFDDAQVTPELVQRYFDLSLRQGNRKAFLERIPFLAPKNHTRVKEITAPTMIQWGKHDKWIAPSTVEEFTRDLPHAVVKWYECGHVPMEEVAAQSAADARAFLLENTDTVPDTLSPEADGSLE